MEAEKIISTLKEQVGTTDFSDRTIGVYVENNPLAEGVEPDEEYFKTLKMYHLDTVMPIISVINYGVILFFIYLFFKNYRTINTTDTVKQLMQSILKTRKTVKYYVWYNLAMTAFSFILVFIFQFMYDPNIRKMVEKMSQNVDPNTFYCIMLVVYAVIIAIFVGLIWLFYRLLYGILMRRLEKNYNELKKIDF